MPIEPSAVTTRPPLAAIADELVQPPSRVYLGVDDRLYIRSRNSLTAVTLQVAGRLLTAGGDIVPFNFEHVPATDRSASLEAFRLAEGYLLSVVVFPSVGAPSRGQTFVELGLLRGRAVAAAVVDVLARDYVSEAEPLAFPGMPIRSSLEGPGVIRSILGTDRAANTELLETVPADARWRLIAFQVQLVTDANAANRTPLLILDDGTTSFFTSPVPTVIPASTTSGISWSEAIGTNSPLASAQQMPLPRAAYLLAGFRVTTVTLNLQVGDNYGAPQLLVEEWIQD